MLAIVPIRDGVLPSGGAETVAECGGRAILIGSNPAEAVAALLGIATELRLIDAATFSPAAWAQALLAVAEEHVVLPASADGRDLAPRLAAALRCPLHAGAVFVSPDRIDVARHGGLTLETVQPTGAFVATLQPGVRGVTAEPTWSAPSVQSLDVTIPAGVDAQVVAVLAPDAATMDLSESARIIGGGAGLATEASFVALAELASRLDASMGATRVITDRGWVGHERQIGTTGVIVDPQLYLAFGISGAVQHTSGLGQPEHIISVNTDPHCPMMQLADLAIVADANAVVDALLQRLGDDV